MPNLNIPIDEALKKALKVAAAKSGKTLKDYAVELLEAAFKAAK